MHLVVVHGPPAVGKMAVGRALSQLTGYPLFHNHMAIEPLLGVFDFGTEPFQRLVRLIRRSVLAEAVGSGLPGLVITYVMDFDDPGDAAFLEDVIAPVTEAGGPVDHLELVAGLDVRLAREGTPLRVAEKRSKRDVAAARALLHRLDGRRLNSEGDFPFTGRHLVVDNSRLSPEAVASRVVDEWGLTAPR
ncbi:DEAD/DEAH box helicase family protein [Auraticoccus monumenti]|uniref:AAA domain-containing protein n=1 Tax=Auraticoccus monumenti TaxID=675864 RepID=A0A1G7C1T4_9ACTN|nr:hypothetical protein [Auraticoccus monumenti]SDE32646.1 hypothetical protein SAMN04489747_3121 [Auraticoccus monumenti]